MTALFQRVFKTKWFTKAAADKQIAKAYSAMKNGDVERLIRSEEFVEICNG